MTFNQAYREASRLGYSNSQLLKNLEANVAHLYHDLANYRLWARAFGISPADRTQFRAKARQRIADIRKAKEWRAALSKAKGE